jgi:hypothetical protein
MKELADLKNLRALLLQYTQVTDAALSDLATLKSLQILNLEGTKVTDADLREIASRDRTMECFVAYRTASLANFSRAYSTASWIFADVQFEVSRVTNLRWNQGPFRELRTAKITML